MKLKIVRIEYTDDTTIGEMFVDGNRFCFTLEDTVRPKGIKVYGHTAIPRTKEGEPYKVDLTYSSRFKRDMPLVYTEGTTLKNNGISFGGIRIHGGNSHKNTHGCPLVAFNRPSKETIQSTAEAPLTERIKKAIARGEEVTLEVVNQPQEK